MKTRYKITIVILLIIGIPVSSIMTIDYVYANTNTTQFIAVSKAICPYFPIPDNFVANQIFFAVYHTDPIKQLDMIHYNFYSVCYKETEDPAPDLGLEYDPSNSKGCPQFCPKDKMGNENYDTLDDITYDLEMMFHEEEYAVEYFVINGNADYIEIDIPTDLINGVFMIHVNGENVDDKRVFIDGNKVTVNYGQNIVSVKLFGIHELGGLENEN